MCRNRLSCGISIAIIAVSSSACGGSTPTTPTSISSSSATTPPNPTPAPTPGPTPPPPPPGPGPTPAPAPQPGPQQPADVRETWSGTFTVQTINGDQSLELIFAPASRLPIRIDVTRNDARLSGRMTLGVLSGDFSGTIDQH